MAGLKVGVGTKKSEKITRKSQQAGNRLPPWRRWAASRGCRAATAGTAAEAGRWVAESACPSHDAKTERFVAWGHFSRSIPITFSSTSSSAFYSDGLQWTNGLRQKLLTIAQCNQKFITVSYKYGCLRGLIFSPFLFVLELVSDKKTLINDITLSLISSSTFYSDSPQWTNGLCQKLLTIAQCNQ